jgi:diacylglycerol kinase family enzyme
VVRRVLIVNPLASGVTPARLQAVVAELEAAGPVDQVRTERAGHATELAAQACVDSAAVFVFAGDGGFNEAVNGMTGDVPMGFIPGGASSILPRALGLPRDPVAAARRLARGERVRRISLGRANGRRFTFAAGIGLDAEVVRAVDRRGRGSGRRPGDVAFAWELARILLARRGRLEPALEVEGAGSAAFAVVANCDPWTYAGPLPVRVTPLARFELGLDLVAPRRVTPGLLARIAWSVLVRPAHVGSPDFVSLHDVDRIVVRCSVPMPFEMDGEDLGDVLEVVFEAERDALSVLV